jgi:nitroimidazol reductase NimA-like FMN-containing flavoprotein (pyridoxamine 5'-phosphate oxidase superfamily)
MKQDVLDILNVHRVLTLATSRPDGWPQATMVGYANDNLVIYMLISRSSQKFANLREDNRVGITIGADADKLADIRGLAMSALAYPANAPDQQRHGYGLLLRRRPEFATLPEPNWTEAAIVRAVPRDVAILDFSKGLGHSDMIRVGPGLVITMDPVRPNDWGPTPHPH